MTGVWYLSGPLGEMLLSSKDGSAINGLWFLQQRFCARGLEGDRKLVHLPVFEETEAWLERFYRGIDPGPVPRLDPAGTGFQLRVWAAMKEIPYGETSSYGELASALAAQEGRRVSPRAVGGAVARNPISILLPCHRVLAADGSLHGYAGGVWRKAALLSMEQGIPFIR